METLIEWMRRVIGEPDFYKQMGSMSNYTWDYGAMFEYVFAGILTCIVVAAIFKFLRGNRSSRL